MSALDPKIGLVTVLYNGKEVLPDFFASLAKQTYKNYVLYVIDNSPNDEALDLAKELASQHGVPAEFVNNNANLGVAKGNNQGIELSLASGCEFVLLLNNDIDFESNVIEDMVHYAVEHNENIIVPKIYYAGTNKIWFAGGVLSYWRARGIHTFYKQEDHLVGKDIKTYITYSPTCFMLINSQVFEQVELFDEEYFVYYDDTDFCFRLKEKSIRILYWSKMIINHRVSFSSGGDDSDFSIYQNTLNKIVYIKKHYVGVAFFIVAFLDIVGKLRFIRSSKRGIYYKAILSGLK